MLLWYILPAVADLMRSAGRVSLPLQPYPSGISVNSALEASYRSAQTRFQDEHVTSFPVRPW